MTKIARAWNEFEKTGSVQAYLNYKRACEDTLNIGGGESLGADIHRRSGDKNRGDRQQ
ncbi:MAG: hypothetical protein IJL87_05390 [Clostridia bacterium]|nr:hypothetical protein [Clostridia bacterium]